MTIASVRAEFSPAGTYLNTASLALPPRRTVDAVAAAVERWSHGLDNAPDFDAPVQHARERYAELVGVDADRVAIGSQVSVLAGIVAAGLPDDAQVLLASGDFTSVMFPFLAQERRGVRVRDVPLADLPGEIGPGTTLVAVAAVQSADGALADLDAIEAAAREHGARTLIDLTQAAGWLPIDAGRFDYTVCAAYKWLLAPRGCAMLTMAPEHFGEAIPHGASWFGNADVWNSIYGAPLRLADTARAYDASPAWHSWVGLEESLDFLLGLGIEQIHAHDVGLADDFLAALGRPPAGSAIVSVPVAPGTAEAAAAAGIQAAMRAGRLRVSFHVNNDADDVARAVEVLGPFVRK